MHHTTSIHQVPNIFSSLTPVVQHNYGHTIQKSLHKFNKYKKIKTSLSALSSIETVILELND